MARRRTGEQLPTTEERELAGQLWDWMAHWRGDIDELVARGVAAIKPEGHWGLTREGRQVLNKVMPEQYALWTRIRDARDKHIVCSPRQLRSLPAMWEAVDNG